MFSYNYMYDFNVCRTEADISDVDDERQEERNLLCQGTITDDRDRDLSIQSVENLSLLSKTTAQSPISAQATIAAQSPISAQISIAAQAPTTVGCVRYAY